MSRRERNQYGDDSGPLAVRSQNTHLVSTVDHTPAQRIDRVCWAAVDQCGNVGISKPAGAAAISPYDRLCEPDPGSRRRIQDAGRGGFRRARHLRASAAIESLGNTYDTQTLF